MQHIGLTLGHFSHRWNPKAWSGVDRRSAPVVATPRAVTSPAKATQPGIKTLDMGTKHTPALEMPRSENAATSTSSIHVLTAYPDGRLEVHVPDLVH